MADDNSADLERLRKEIAYYKRQVTAVAGENLKLDYMLPGMRHELKQKREGFALLSQLQQSVGAHQQISAIFEITIAAINATLGMDHTLILVPTERENFYRPSHWTGYRQEATGAFPTVQVELPPDFRTGSSLLLVNRATPRTELIQRLTDTFEVPFFIAVPATGESAAVGVILAGRLNETPPFWPALDSGDVDTLRAIAGLITATIKNMRVAVLEETDRLKTEFFSNISHEFRTPITLTLGPIEQILAGTHGAIPTAVHQQLDLMHRNQSRLLGLVNQILDLAKLEAGQMRVRATRARHLNQLIEDRAATFRSAAGKPEVELSLSLDPAVVTADLYVDREKFDKLLFNLLSNAYKFTRQGSIALTTEVTGGLFRLTVRDTGVGIRDDQIPYIFDRFRQADASVSREFGGTGLGLALVQEVAKLHGGDVVAYSQFGKGSTFQVTLPLGKAHLQAADVLDVEGDEPGGRAAMPVAEPQATGADIEEANARAERERNPERATIVYAEDNPELRSYVCGLLRPEYNVFVAADGQDGMEKAHRYAPDLIITDFMMPRVSGREFLQSIRNDPTLHRLPVIFLTARAGSAARVESLHAGADDYLTKPFDQGELLARVRNLLRARNQERELEELSRRLEARVEEQMAELVRSGELQRFLPQSIVSSVLAGTIHPGSKFERRKITIVFAAIADFAQLTETLEPEDLSSLVNDYLRETTAIAVAHGGTIDAIVGGSLMILFGAPEAMPVEQQVSAAIESARRMHARGRELQSLWQSYGVSDVLLQIGMNTGFCTLGVFGSDVLRSYTAVGAPLTLAARLQEKAPAGSVLIGLPTYAIARQKMSDARGPLNLSGTSGSVQYYELPGSDQSVGLTERESAEPPERPAAREQMLTGKMVAHFRIVTTLGAGGMGVVYLAEDTKLGRRVALKVLPLDFAADRQRLQRFLLEARSASSLNHTNVAQIYEIGEDEGMRFIAMEYVEGQSLDSRIDGQPLDIGDMLNISLQIAEALEEAHQKGIVHRDIKPQNIAITPRGQVKVLDFGLAKVSGEADADAASGSTRFRTEAGTVVGTVHYMSPEQALGRAVDERTDIFSLGVVMYEMTTGRLPFSGATRTETVDLLLHTQPPPIGQLNDLVPPPLGAMIEKCLNKDPNTRYGSVRELLADLRAARRVG